MEEKELNLAVSKKLFDYLKEKGFEVALSRSDDSRLTIDQRVEKADKFFEGSEKNIFVSVHFNSTDPNTCRSISQSLVFYDQGNTVSQDFATTVSQSMARNGTALETGARSETETDVKSLGVFRTVTNDKILVEVEFVCNPNLTSKITSEEGQKKYAEAIGEGVIVYAKKMGGSTGTVSGSAWHESIKTTWFNDSGTAGNCSGSCAALPHENALGKKIEVCLMSGSKCVITTVGDLGPFCILDTDYVFGHARPYAEIHSGTVFSTNEGPKCNPRGIAGYPASTGAALDLTTDLFTQLFGNTAQGVGYTKWRFVE